MNKPQGWWVGGRQSYHVPMREEDVTFTFLEDGFYLPSIGVVLPEGQYRGRITRDGERLVDVLLIVPKAVAKKVGLTSTLHSITTDYRSGLVGEDRE